ncbi:hypothetical protein P43SY_001138 [Pythium insidiosum]|uniref:Tudor domain-containing protein n=1 Tax=Pythium insidiosum TaxID=114742 RepID=A0AAD5QBU7_PYTIN|nr:hypothetical protein P43SY_001138 [Pythium insidiosum]
MAQPASNADAIGWRVRVFWEGDDEWFAGRITEFCPSRGFYVRYDDGEEQWEAADASTIEYLCAPSQRETLLIPSVQNQWSAEPPPSTGGQPSPTPYDDEFEDELDDLEPVSKKSPTPGRYNEDDDEEEGGEEGEEADKEHARDPPKLPRGVSDRPVDTSVRAPASRSSRAVNVNRAIFFRDDETLSEMKMALQREKAALKDQLNTLKRQVEEKELQSSALRRELRDLKAHFTLASMTSTGALSLPLTAKSMTLPRRDFESCKFS